MKNPYRLARLESPMIRLTPIAKITLDSGQARAFPVHVVADLRAELVAPAL